MKKAMQILDNQNNHDVSKSFIQVIFDKTIGTIEYENMSKIGGVTLVLGTPIIIVTFILSLFLHWTCISDFLLGISGYSLIFIAYVVVSIIFIDSKLHEFCCRIISHKKKKWIWRQSVFRACVLFAIGICSIVYTERYSTNYAFQCETFLVDEVKNIYHIDCFIDDCEEINIDTYLIKLKGYQIMELDIPICEQCDYMAAVAEVFYKNDYVHP